MTKASTKLQWIILVTTAAVNLFGSMSASIQAPFYPAEAEMKGATATEYGIVLGSFELTSFLASPIFGKIVEKQGPKSLLGYGVTLSAITIILFGLLDYVSNRVLFIGLSLVLRVLEAFGGSAAVVAGFSLIGSVFPDSISTIFASMEIFFGVGYIIGPIIGGILYEIGGFSFPFICIGIYGIVCSFIIFCIPMAAYERSTTKIEYRIGNLLQIPSILLYLVCIVFFEMSGGFYVALLEPHLRIFHLSPTVTSLFFVISGATYGFVSPFVGKLLDTCVQPKTMIIVSCIFCIGSFTLIGPLPFLPFQTSIPFCIVALFIQGLAFATGYVATFTGLLRAAKIAGFPDGVGTYGLVSGVWSSGYSFGGFIGPSIAGLLYDLVGFRNATVFVWSCSIIVLIGVIICNYIIERRPRGYEVMPS